MEVFFICSIDGMQQYGKDYMFVLDTIKSLGQSVYSKITHEDYAVFNKKFGTKSDPKINKAIDGGAVVSPLYDSTRRAIMWVDVVIIDNSYSSFRLGHEATIAVQHKKPTLILSQTKDYSKLIDTSYFYGAKYNRYNLKRIVEEFIQKAQKQVLKNRFNLMLTDEQKEMLEILALKKGISQAEVLRDALEKLD